MPWNQRRSTGLPTLLGPARAAAASSGYANNRLCTKSQLFHHLFKHLVLPSTFLSCTLKSKHLFLEYIPKVMEYNLDEQRGCFRFSVVCFISDVGEDALGASPECFTPQKCGDQTAAVSLSSGGLSVARTTEATLG